MGWNDLGLAWFFELGTTPFKFVDGDKTTEDLKKHEGVNEARKLACDACKKGDHNPKPHVWTYGAPQFYASIANNDSAAIFLGSYTIKVKSSSDCTKLNFLVENPSTWESATRFRKAAQPGGQHQGVVPNRDRGGPGIQLGGAS